MSVVFSSANMSVLRHCAYTDSSSVSSHSLSASVFISSDFKPISPLVSVC